MKKQLQNIITPLCLFGFGLILLGCNQQNNSTNSEKPISEVTESAASQVTTPSLKSGSMLSMVQDIANIQLQAGSYIEQLKQTQQQLQDAANTHNQQQLSLIAPQLKQQLTDLNETLNALHLKSQEISDIRDKVIQSNKQVLISDFLNGQLDIKAAELQQIQQQMGSVQAEMLKLANMFIDGQSAASAAKS